MAISNSASPEIMWGLGGPEEDHQLHHCCWTGCVSEREGEEDFKQFCDAGLVRLVYLCSFDSILNTCSYYPCWECLVENCMIQRK